MSGTGDLAAWIVRRTAEPAAPQDGGLAALAADARDAVLRIEDAVAAGDNELIVWACRAAVEATMAIEQAEDTAEVWQAIWLAGFAAAETACPVPLRGQRHLTIVPGGPEAAGAPPDAVKPAGRHRKP